MSAPMLTPGSGGGSKPKPKPEPQKPTVPLVVYTAFDADTAQTLKERLEQTIHPVDQPSPARKKATHDPPPYEHESSKGPKAAPANRETLIASEPVIPDLPQDIPWSSEAPFPSLDAGEMSDYFSAQEDNLVREVSISLQLEKFILDYLDDPLEYLKHFATYTWDEDSDAAAEKFIQWYVERFRTELERQREYTLSLDALSGIEYWIREVANDKNESVIVVDLETGETLFVRYGDRDSVTMHTLHQKLAEGRNIALIHNHPNNSGASWADLSAAAWLDAEYMMIVNRDGAVHRHQKIDGEIVELEPLHNPDIIAPVNPVETVVDSIAYWIQTLREIGNPAEMVFEQGEGQVVIDIGNDSTITLTPLEGQTLEVSQTLAERLWNNVVLEGLEGVPINHVLVRDLLLKWQTFSQSESSRQRDAAYRLRSEIVEQAEGIQSELKFFHAAQTVNHFMSLNEYIGNVMIANISARRGLLDFADTEVVTGSLDEIGKRLFAHNDPILATTLETNDGLPSPYYNSPEDMGGPAAQFVDSAIDWDVHMVWREQGKVEEIINVLGIEQHELKLVSAQFHQEEYARNVALGHSVFAIDWA